LGESVDVDITKTKKISDTNLDDIYEIESGNIIYAKHYNNLL